MQQRELAPPQLSSVLAPTLQQHPRCSCLHFRILNLAGCLRGSFLRGQRMERGGGAEAFPVPCPGWDGWYLPDQNPAAGTQAFREYLPPGAAGEGWICKTGVGGQALGVGCPAVPEPGGVTIRPHPPPPGLKGRVSEPGGPC